MVRMHPRVLVILLSMVFATALFADPSSPIAMTNVDSPDPVSAGSEIIYTITMTNTGGSKVTNVVFTDQLNGVGGPPAQIAAVIEISKGILKRWPITPARVVAHSDIAPNRKIDPGELFPWEWLARLRLALPSPTKNLMDPHWTDAGFLLALERFGYDVTDPLAAIRAFQRRFRPNTIDGIVDGECRAKLLALLLPRPMGDD